MRALKLTGSVYLAVMAGWVIWHFLGHTFFEDPASEAHPEAEERLAALNVFMAVAFLLTAITAFQTFRREGRESPPAPGWLLSNLFFYLTVLVAVPFLANWVASMEHSDDGLLWIYVETVGPLTWAIQSARLWRSAQTTTASFV